MEYKAAFNSVIKKYGIEILVDNFALRSLLSDSVGASFIDKELIDAFFILNINNLEKEISSLSLIEAKALIKKRISSSTNKYKPIRYIRSVEPLLILKYPEYKELEEKKKIHPVIPSPVKRNVTINNKVVLPVINKPKAPTHNIDTLEIVVIGRDFTIKTTTGKEIQILDKPSIDVTNQFPPVLNKNKCTITISDKNRDLTLLIPKKKYKKLSLYFNGEGLDIGDVDYFSSAKRITTNEFYFVIENGYANINVNATKLAGKQDRGYLCINGAIRNMMVKMNNADFYSVIDDSNPKKYHVYNEYGVIDMWFSGGKVKPRINHIFKAVRDVNATYTINNHTLELSLHTGHGKITVR